MEKELQEGNQTVEREISMMLHDYSCFALFYSGT